MHRATSQFQLSAWRRRRYGVGEQVATTQERLAAVEATAEEHGHMLNGIQDALASLESKMNQRFEQVDQRFEQIDRRLERVERRVDHLEHRMDSRFTQLDGRIDSLDAKVSRHFVWLAGMLMSGMVATLSIVAAAFFGGR